jgi:hypothetical protein
MGRFEMLRNRSGIYLFNFFASIDGSVAFEVCSNTTGAFLSRRIDRFKKDFKSEFFILFGCL